MRKGKSAFHTNFTLVELLVAVSIIAILAGLLLPVLSSVREHAYVAVCTNNIKQQQAALANYLHTSDGMFPAQVGSNDKLNESRWYGAFLWLMEESIPKGLVMEPAGGIRNFNPEIDSFSNGNAEAGKAMPLAWICPAIRSSHGNISFSSNYDMRYHRYGLFLMQNSDRNGMNPENTPIAGKVGKLPSPASYSYMAESGWEPLQSNKFTEHINTPYAHSSSVALGNLDGFTQYGHRKGWSVAYLDGHVKFHNRKRVSQKSGQLTKWTGIFATRVVDSSDL